MLHAFAPVLLALTLAGQAAPAAPPARGDVLHRMTLLRAAPGRLLDLVADVRTRARDAAPGSRPLLLRHSQGDQWDIMILLPLAGDAARVDRAASIVLAAPDLVAWQEDALVRGPDLWAFPGVTGAGLFHLEMFVALAGKRDELVREREMENAYLAELGRPVNAIFVREFGAAWDAFTVGAYRSWTHYGERDAIAPERAAAAAKRAGFESDAHIGAYMRSLIAMHHDTLTTPIR